MTTTTKTTARIITPEQVEVVVKIILLTYVLAFCTLARLIYILATQVLRGAKLTAHTLANAPTLLNDAIDASGLDPVYLYPCEEYQLVELDSDQSDFNVPDAIPVLDDSDVVSAPPPFPTGYTKEGVHYDFSSLLTPQYAPVVSRLERYIASAREEVNTDNRWFSLPSTPSDMRHVALPVQPFTLQPSSDAVLYCLAHDVPVAVRAPKSALPSELTIPLNASEMYATDDLCGFDASRWAANEVSPSTGTTDTLVASPAPFNMTVAALRDRCRAKGLKVSGSKADLVARLTPTTVIATA